MNTMMWHIEIRCSGGLGSVRYTVGLDDTRFSSQNDATVLDVSFYSIAVSK